MEVQERKNSVQKDVEDYKLETQRFLNEMNQKIREGKAAHMELTNEVWLFVNSKVIYTCVSYTYYLIDIFHGSMNKGVDAGWGLGEGEET